MFLSVQSLSSTGASAPGWRDCRSAAVHPNAALDVDQVLRHVGSSMAEPDLEVCVHRLMDTADTCGRLIGDRRLLGIAFKLQHHIEGVEQVAMGREPMRPTPQSERDALRSVIDSARASVGEAQTRWQKTSDRFTRLTHLLPTQLDSRLDLPASLPLVSRQALKADFIRCGFPVPVQHFDAALAAYAAAHRRCQLRVGPALAAVERRRSTGIACRTGLVPLSALAMALFEEFLNRQSLLLAESERAGAHHVLHMLADLRSFCET